MINSEQFLLTIPSHWS